MLMRRFFTDLLGVMAMRNVAAVHTYMEAA